MQKTVMEGLREIHLKEKKVCLSLPPQTSIAHLSKWTVKRNGSWIVIKHVTESYA